MSKFRLVSDGENRFLTLALAINYTLRLFTTDVTTGLTDEDIEALDETDFTEATFAGYSAATLTGGSWTIVSTDPSYARYAQQTFTRSSTGTSQNVYGYYLTNPGDADSLVGFEQFDGPIAIAANGDAIRVTPLLTLDEGDNVTPTGMIAAFGGTTAPTGWLLCNGAAVSRTGTNTALFAAIGTAFGAGNGTTTFNLPDLRQRFPLGVAASGTGNTLGGTGGAINHTHGLNTATSHAKINAASNVINHLRKTVASFNENVSFTATGGATASTADANTLGTELGGTSDTGDPPFQAVHFIIKL